jgi:hypothetical protein
MRIQERINTRRNILKKIEETKYTVLAEIRYLWPIIYTYRYVVAFSVVDPDQQRTKSFV